MNIPYKHCEYCNIPIKYQSGWIRHCKSKRHLKRIEKESQKNHLESKENHLESKENHLECQENLSMNSKMYHCRFCNKEYKTNSNMNRHIKNSCKVKQQEDNLLKQKDLEIEKLKQQLQEKDIIILNLQKQITTTNNTTNNNNQTINLTINNYGQEDFSSLMNKDMFLELQQLTGIPLARKMIKNRGIRASISCCSWSFNTRSSLMEVLEFLRLTSTSAFAPKIILWSLSTSLAGTACRSR